ncbi:hypothetical protein [Bradyrhizobium liaoningense]|uniref:hypothetical protein n=1 Tax=Bradyrhizobium liaoningense TaxID=43992 RepID=UPI001BACBAF2|nr:hypothetical protein [Bradyrhizobium liaoningense]MBR1033885.1 hypothetical protein [Bradyrhizobium liaoningense]
MPSSITRRGLMLGSAAAGTLLSASSSEGIKFQLAPGETRLVPNLLAPEIDLFDTPIPQFNLVDGTVAIVTSERQPFVLLKGYDQDKWFFAPRWGRLATNPNGRPAFTITKKVRNNPDGSRTTLGGQISLMVDLVVQLPNDDTRQEWAALIKAIAQLNPRSGAFNFQPLPLSKGKMNIYGLDQFLAPGQKTKDVPVGASSTIAMVFDLNPDGADYFYTLVGMNTASPTVAIMLEFQYDRFIPKCLVQARGLKKKTYDFFSADAKARASYFGLVSGSGEYSNIRKELRSIDGLDVSIIGEPPAGIDQQKLLDSLQDQFIKLEVGQWIDPSKSTPANAESPGGYYGGVSVAIKQEHFSDEERFDRRISFARIEQEMYQASFSFEQQVSKLLPAEHAFLIQDDKKLPFLVTASASNVVRLYAIAAAYGAGSDATAIRFDSIDAKKGGIASVNGVPGGIIQFPAGGIIPTSAEVTATIDFDPPMNGYLYRQTVPITPSGASFYIQPDVFVQNTSLFFSFTLDATDPKSKALFQWKFTSTNGPNTVGGAILILPDPNGAMYNVASYLIRFPFHPNDVKIDGSGPKIEFAMKGVAGDWRGRQSNGTIELQSASLEIDWIGQRSVNLSAFASDRLR